MGNAEDLQWPRSSEHHPDAAVVDVRMPPGYTDEGIRAAIAIRRDHPGTGGAGLLPVHAVTAMLSVQVGSALSVHLITAVGAAGTAWLRLSIGSVIFLAVARPPLRLIRRRDIPSVLGLGVTTGLQTIAFLAAIDRIPLGTAVAIEFLGPLAVAALHSHSARAFTWLVVALLGVTVLTEPWQGHMNAAGVVFAGLAALGWASYILLTQRIADRFTGTSGLSLTVPIAAATAAIAGIPQAAGRITGPAVLLAAAGLAILLPVLPYAFEMLALRRMN